MPIKHTILFSIIAVTLLLKVFHVGTVLSTIIGIAFGTIGLGIIFIISHKKGKMMHCILYCPIGTLVNYLKYINPFSMHINMKCITCSYCSSVCKYDALSLKNIINKKPGITCTYCGDCLNTCDANAIHYTLFSFGPNVSHKIYLFLTISIHAIFMAMARI